MMVTTRTGLEQSLRPKVYHYQIFVPHVVIQKQQFRLSLHQSFAGFQSFGALQMFRFSLDLLWQGWVGREFMLLPAAQVWIALGFGLSPMTEELQPDSLECSGCFVLNLQCSLTLQPAYLGPSHQLSWCLQTRRAGVEFPMSFFSHILAARGSHVFMTRTPSRCAVHGGWLDPIACPQLKQDDFLLPHWWH